MVCRAGARSGRREARVVGCHPKWRRTPGNSTLHGLDDETSATVGPGLSRGEVIRSLMRSRRPCRFTSLSGDAQAMGFPPSPAGAFVFGQPHLSAGTRTAGFASPTTWGGVLSRNEDERITNILAAQVAHITNARACKPSLHAKPPNSRPRSWKRKRSETEVARTQREVESAFWNAPPNWRRPTGELESFSYSVSQMICARRSAISTVSRSCWKDALGPENARIQARHFFSQITGSATQMSELVDALLEFSRMGRVELRRQEWTCRPWVQTVVSATRPETGDPRSSGKWEPAESAGDAALLRQGVCQSPANAIKNASPPAGPGLKWACWRDSRGNGDFCARQRVGFDMAGWTNCSAYSAAGICGEEFEGTGVGLANCPPHHRASWRQHLGGQRNRRWAAFNFSLPAPVKESPQ